MGKSKQRQIEREMMDATNAQLEKYMEEQKAQKIILDEQKQQYREFTFENPYADMENFYEDLEVSTEAAEFQMEQGRQQRATLLSQLRGAAGASGIAGLAQTLAGQGQLQARQVSVDIAQQERQNAMLAARGAQQTDMLRRQGEAAVQQAEFGRESTLLGMEFGAMTGAYAAMQAAYGNQMAAFGSRSQMQSARIGMWGDIIGGTMGGWAGTW